MATLITVFADASLREGHSHYGYWFKSTLHCSQGSGKKTAHSIEHAELIGICHGIASAIKTHGEVGEIALVVQCDNLSALGLLKTLGNAKQASTSPIDIPPRKKWHPDEAQLIEELRSKLLEVPIWLKHVKGHTSKRDGRSGVNRLTDRLSKGLPAPKRRK